jgi:hypothetical protein
MSARLDGASAVLLCRTVQLSVLRSSEFFTECIRETHDVLNKGVYIIIYVYLETLTCALSLKGALVFLCVLCVLLDSVTTNWLIICKTQADKSGNPTVDTSYMLLQKLVTYLPNYTALHPRGP